MPPLQRLLCILLLVISWIPYSMNTFPFPNSMVIHLTMAWLSYVTFFLTKWHLSVILNIKQGDGNLNRFIDKEKIILKSKGTVIYRKRKGKSLLFGRDVMFTCYGKLGEFMPASTLTSTFVLALTEEKSPPLNFLYFSTQLSLKSLAKQSKTAKKMLPFHCWVIQLGGSKGLPRITFLCFSDVMFTCQGKFGEFMPASKLASPFVLAFIEGVFMPLNRQ